eukprot:m51a1_g8856 putative serine threonine-protein kinase ctr1 (1042) ;mRNA; f:513306-517527
MPRPPLQPADALSGSLCSPVRMLLLLLLLLAACCARAAESYPAVSSRCATQGDLVIGLSADNSTMQRNAAAGLRAAIDEIRQVTKLPLTLLQLNHTDEEGLADNVVTLVTEGCAFVAVGRPGTSLIEERVLATLRHYNVPLVGALSGNEGLRNTRNHTGLFYYRGAKVRLPLVVNVRASGSDEINLVLQDLVRDWGSLGSVSLLAHNTPFGNWTRDYINSVLSFFALQNTLHTTALLGANRDVEVAATQLFPAGKEPPKSIVVCTMAGPTWRLVRWLAHSGHANVTLYLLSWASAAGFNEKLDADSETRALLVRHRIEMRFTQSMPFPRPSSEELATSSSLLWRFSKSAVRARTHAALEGYLTGWFIYEVAQQSVNRHGLPLTRSDFLSTVFIDVRTFNVLDMTLGPYGDGGISGVSQQAESEACNQGVHELYMTRFEASNSSLSPMPDRSLHFKDCKTPRLSSSREVTLVGMTVARGSSEDSQVYDGLLGAMRFHNQLAKDAVVLKVEDGDSVQAAKSWNDTNVVAVVSPRIGSPEEATVFSRMIINLFPTATDEAVAAFQFFRKMEVDTAPSLMLDTDAATRNMTYSLRVSPPYSNFTGTETGYNYISSMRNNGPSARSFESFFVGEFLSQIVTAARKKTGGKPITANDLVNIVYTTTFEIGPVVVQGFRESSTALESCNQGLDTVYVVREEGLRISHMFHVGNCGRDYIIGEKGHCGSIYAADWHGTPVSVRVIDKRATPKEDLRIIKEEVLLLHKLHHPNLLMLMGYCETRSDLLVVTEDMTGTLGNFLLREKRNANMFSLVALAFMDAKGTVKVADFWYSNKRGAFSASGSGRSLKRAAWQPPEVIAGTFLTPATDVYAFGIVLWELIAPIDMAQHHSSASSDALSEPPSTQSSTADGMLSVGIGGIIELQGTQLGPPDIPPDASPEVADLLERCWQTQPERRPSIFQILRNWPTTFSSLGAFEIPRELDLASAGSGSGTSHKSGHSGPNNGEAGAQESKERNGDVTDEMIAASMLSIMPHKEDRTSVHALAGSVA